MLNAEAEKLKAARQYNTRIANQDRRHLNMAYVQLHDALNELELVFKKDNVLTHMVRQLGAMEDTLFEYITPTKGRK